MYSKRKKTMVRLILCALFIAMQVVLSRFLSINLQYLKIGFSFIPIMFASYLFGPAGGVAVATVSDLIGSIAFPSGPFFPGFTVTAALSGLIYGLSFHKNCSTAKIVAGVFVNEFFCSGILNTLWLSIMYTSDFKTLIATRVWQAVAMATVQIVFAEIFFNRLKIADKLKRMIK